MPSNLSGQMPQKSIGNGRSTNLNLKDAAQIGRNADVVAEEDHVTDDDQEHLLSKGNYEQIKKEI